MLRTRSDVIVIGGGVAGLAAAAALARSRFRVLLIEARERLGGRILTLRDKGWPAAVELGAEFLHAGNPEFLRFIRRHRVRTSPMPARHWRHLPSAPLQRLDDLAERIEAVTTRIDARRMRGWSFQRFLRAHAKEVAAADRDLVSAFVEGFEAAPRNEMSAAAMAGQTLDDEEQARFPDGYDRIVAALLTELPPERVRIRLGSVVDAVTWRRGDVTVHVGGDEHVARAAVITLPLGVRQARAVRFTPALRAQDAVVRRMGMGHVTRINVRFDPTAWRRLLPSELRGHAERGFGFIHSRVRGLPIWWALTPNSTLTAWAGGPAALALVGKSERALRETALRSLAQLWGIPEKKLCVGVRGWATHSWSRDPFSRGAYSFTRVGADDAAEQLRQPVAQTLFFAGEATADGEEVGTVHGAFSSGRRAAREVFAAL